MLGKELPSIHVQMIKQHDGAVLYDWLSMGLTKCICGAYWLCVPSVHVHYRRRKKRHMAQTRLQRLGHWYGYCR